MKVFEMFSGYGGATFALKKAGIPHEVVGYSEIDKYAIQCYNQNHWTILEEDEETKEITYLTPKNFGDCTKINPNDLPDFDLLTGGFPCQAFSVAGKGKGEQDTRGTLFHEIIRIAEAKKPKYMLLENVKGLTFKSHKETFEKILSELNRIGYHVTWRVLNSKEYGIPQNRERVFFVCYRGDLWKEYARFEFPDKVELKIFLKDILEDSVEDKYYLSEKAINGIMKSKYRERNPQIKDICDTLKIGGDVKCIIVAARGRKNVNGKYNLNAEFNTSGYSNCLTTSLKENYALMIGNLSRYNMKNPRNPNFKEEGVSWCVSTKSDIGVLHKVGDVIYTIRRLTPKEYFRLMGFLDDEINLEGLSNTQQYKLAGNGWDINLVSKIFERMFK